MSLILITGISTSGKSTVAKELLSRGLTAIDIEHSGHAAYYHSKTGKRVAEFGEAHEHTNDWLKAHQWLIDVEWVKSILKEAKYKNIYICGGGSNEIEVAKLCDKVIWLSIDEKTIHKRVQNPRDHDYGTRPHELAKIIEQNRTKEKSFYSIKALIIDATKPLKYIVDEILVITR